MRENAQVDETLEVNFDGLVGPTHNYSGLSHGNLASTSFKSFESSPLQAALQGLEKMKRLADGGFKQGVLPPQERPEMETLRRLGFTGSDKKILNEVLQKSPDLLLAVTSASSMWTANAATVSPSADTADHKIHFTPANLVTKFHRAIEAESTSNILKKIFKNPKYFNHHAPLPACPAMGDEGAANHTRLCSGYGKKGIEFFVYGRRGLSTSGLQPKKFPARQTLEACETLARTHLLDSQSVIFAQQNPDAIDFGVFHNDVVAVGNQNVYFYHEEAYVDPAKVMGELQTKFQKVCGGELELLQVPANKVSLNDAVKSYLFNSQLITTTPGKMALIAPSECKEIPSVAMYIETLLSTNTPINEVRYFNLRQSMQNGGGPACLRLRVVLKPKELEAINQKTLLNEKLYDCLVTWVKKHYRDKLKIEDLSDPQLVTESQRALDELTKILGLGSIYRFQRD